MAVERHFLGWNAPVLEGVCRYLLSDVSSDGPVDLAGLLIVAPTRQAGRRLREALARHCGTLGKSLVSARVVTPAFFFRGEKGVSGEASPTAVKAVWADVLGRVDPHDYSGVFPPGDGTRDAGWTMYTGEMIQSLRNTLADGGYLLRDVVDQHGDALEERARWLSMARLEGVYLDSLKKLGLCDPCDLKIRNAESLVPADDVGRIVICAVPDPSLLTIRALARLGESLQIDVLVHAPVEMLKAFDEWGRPRSDLWDSCEIPVPDQKANVQLSGSPLLQAQVVLDVIAGESGRFGPADVAVGVPDRAVIPFLQAALSAHGLVAFDPADRPVAEHALYRLLASYADLVCDGKYAAVAGMLRHPDVLAFLATRSAGASVDAPTECTALNVLRELDEFQNLYLPTSLEDMLARLKACPADTGRGRTRFAHLPRALEAFKSFVDDFRTLPLEEALRACLQAVYACRILSSRSAEDQDLTAVAGEVDKALREVSEDYVDKLGISSKQALRLLLRRVGEQSYSAEADEVDIDLEGWLELHWNDAPLLVVTGMNEGTVPDGRLSDVFLPDSLRRTLELRDDHRRLARDSYLMRCLIESRREGGRACFIAGKTSVSGDPLKPSRLLFRCQDARLPERAARLFGAVTETRENHPASVSFLLNPWSADGLPRQLRPVTELSVTAFRAYLACPFRFYLGRVLRMEPLDDAKTNLDALDFGNLVHDALEALGRDEALRASRDASELETFFTGRAEAWVRSRYGAQPALPVLVTLDAAKQRLAAAAREQTRLIAEGWETIRTECTLTGRLAGVTIKGKVDRIDRHRQTGSLRIIDYKTSDGASVPADAHLAPGGEGTPAYQRVEVGGKIRRWVDLQLPLYEWLASADGELAGEKSVAYFNLPKAVGHTGVSVWEDLTADVVASATSCAEWVIAGVCRGEFWPAADRLPYDDYGSLFPQGIDACVSAPVLSAREAP